MRPSVADRLQSVTVRHSACATGRTPAATIAADARIDFSACALRPHIGPPAVIGRPGRAQVAVYAALGVVLLLLGVKSLRAGGTETAGAGGGPGFTVASEPVGVGGPGAGSGDVVVHVAGAVGEPGVYRFPAGARVADAVERAGGPTGRALPDGINLAARLADGQQVVVPERVPGTGAAPALATGAAEEGPISLGSATIADLETIDGIGPVTAGDIIAFRDEHGGIAEISELDAVPGIGPATIESLSERLQP